MACAIDIGPPPIRLGDTSSFCAEPMRAKIQDQSGKASAVGARKSHGLNFTMPDVDQPFRKGHRIMVQI
jgi:hypothetical protein